MTEQFAFVDESLRPGRYLLGCVVVESEHAGELRRAVRHLLLPGQRKLHFKTESARRRRELLVAFGALDVTATVYVCRTKLGRNQEMARAECLARVVHDLQQLNQSVQLFIERRDGLDDVDRVVLRRARRPEPMLSFEHLKPDQDPLLWLPDCFAWPVGAGGDWRRRVRPLLDGIVDLP